MLKVRRLDEESQAFDRMLALLPGASVYQAASWAEIRSGTHACWRFAAERDGASVLVLQVLSRTLRGGGLILHAPRGPAGDLEDLAALSALLDAVRAAGRSLRAVALVCDPQVPEGRDGPLLAAGFRRRPRPDRTFGGQLPRRVWRVPLGPSPGDAERRFAPETRRVCRRAREAGLVAGPAGPDVLETLSRQMADAGDQRGYQVPEAGRLRLLYAAWQRHGQARIYACRKDGELLAACLATEFGGESLGHFAGSVPDRGQASRLLHWSAIADAESRGLRVYDMGGIPDDAKHPQAEGLRTFKRGFGGTEQCWGGEYVLALSPLRNRGYELLARLRGRPIAN